MRQLRGHFGQELELMAEAVQKLGRAAQSAVEQAYGAGAR